MQWDKNRDRISISMNLRFQSSHFFACALKFKLQCFENEKRKNHTFASNLRTICWLVRKRWSIGFQSHNLIKQQKRAHKNTHHTRIRNMSRSHAVKSFLHLVVPLVLSLWLFLSFIVPPSSFSSLPHLILSVSFLRFVFYIYGHHRAVSSKCRHSPFIFSISRIFTGSAISYCASVNHQKRFWWV